ncbi:hypothetical protein JW859_12295 [bacterium]|nr:hypothetical protein [bacterium]
MRRNLPIAGLLLAACLLALAATPPPETPEIELSTRNLTLTGDRLEITPGEETTYLRFSDGVTVRGESFSLTAETVELDVITSDAWQESEIKLPQMPTDTERISRDPGQAIAEMARELELPRARFSENSVRRVGAAGDVRIESTNGIVLATAELVSTDGGRSWAATGRSTVSHNDPVTGEVSHLSADRLLLDSLTSRALARGNIEAEFQQADLPLVSVKAERCELNLAERTLTVTDGLQASIGEIKLCCGQLSADLSKQMLTAFDSPHIEDSATGMTLDAGLVEFQLETQLASAMDNVWINDPVREFSLSAETITADLRNQVYRAQGEPRATYQSSFYTGQVITVTRDGEKILIEIEGPQHGRINLDELPDAEELPLD